MLCNRPAPVGCWRKGRLRDWFWQQEAMDLTPFTVSGSHETVHPFGQHRELQERWHAAQELREAATAQPTRCYDPG
jgi:hypothetical protein